MRAEMLKVQRLVSALPLATRGILDREPGSGKEVMRHFMKWTGLHNFRTGVAQPCFDTSVVWRVVAVLLREVLTRVVFMLRRPTTGRRTTTGAVLATSGTTSTPATGALVHRSHCQKHLLGTHVHAAALSCRCVSS